MSCTLYYLMYRVMSELGIVMESVASTSSTGMIVDTSNRAETDDYWNNGTVYLFTSGSPAAKTGEVYGVTDFTSSGTIVLSDAAASVDSGQAYAVSKRRYPSNIVKQKINQAIEEIGNIVRIDTSLSGIADTYTYAIPSAATYDLRQVWMQSEDDDEIYDEIDRSFWRVEKPNTPGGQANIIFTFVPNIGKTIKLVYIGLHDRLYNPSDILDDQINEERVVYRAVRNCLLWRKQKTGGDNDLTDMLNYYNAAIERTDMLHPVRSIPKTPKRVRVTWP